MEPASPDARDWWTRATREDCIVSSVAVSSTGWPSGNSELQLKRDRELWSCYSSASGYSQHSLLSGDDFHQHLSLKELQEFSNALTEPLRQAKDCMHEVEDVVEGLEQIMTEAVETVNSAACAASSLVRAARHCSELLQPLTSIEEDTCRRALIEAHTVVSQLHEETRSVRGSYINLLDKVGYIGKCIEVTMDENRISQMESPQQDVDGNYVDKLPDPKQPKREEQLFENSLRMALVHLDLACSVLEDCPEFWLKLHDVELSLYRLEKKASKAVASFLLRSGHKLVQLVATDLNTFCKKQLKQPAAGSQG